ncbi:GTPase-activating protein, partial [Cladochytrium tenue]
MPGHNTSIKVPVSTSAPHTGGNSPNASSESRMLGEIAELNSKAIRFNKFKALLDSPIIDIEELKKLSWKGVPDEVRPTVWKILMGYLPTNSNYRSETLQIKRRQYDTYVDQSFAEDRKASLDQGLHHQIHIDVQRTNAHLQLYQNPRVQQALERILYCWAIRHPASGYVQGINDLATPFIHVFLQAYVDGSVESSDLSSVPEETLREVEADSFWCLSKLLDGIQDNYTHGQPGIQRQI